jgi:hypothetical protein
MLPMLDMWTDVFATIGKRSTGTGTGTGAQDYVIVGPGYSGNLPDDVHVIHAPPRTPGSSAAFRPADRPTTRPLLECRTG